MWAVLSKRLVKRKKGRERVSAYSELNDQLVPERVCRQDYS